ncbi:unnamed protein product [Paramecium pentaurelia]|uniref:Uncharacterized protein n=1 Tax=Paramecium pentaurelia TaxID=43138 RepID=A0A8S1URF3_9CILI|nr:unnamed protein product [Paramecium pentaurelia]
MGNAIQKSGLKYPESVKELKNQKCGSAKSRNKKDINMTYTHKYTKDHSKYGKSLTKDSESSSACISFIKTVYLFVEGQISGSNQSLQKKRIINFSLRGKIFR